MSCPNCNNNNNCPSCPSCPTCPSTTPNECCPEEQCGCKIELDSKCVRYTGNDLPCLGVIEGERLESILKKADALLCNAADDTCSSTTDNITFDGVTILCDTETLVEENAVLTSIIIDLYNRICNPIVERGFNVSISKGPSLTADTFFRESILGVGVFNTFSKSSFDSEFPFIIERNNCFEDLTIKITNLGAFDVLFAGITDTLVLPLDFEAIFALDMDLDNAAPDGNYQFELVFSTPLCGSIKYNMEFIKIP